MNIYFENIFSESYIPANYKTPNDYFKVNLLSLRDGLFNLYIILKLGLFYEIAALYPRAYFLILPIIIPECKAEIASWSNFSMSLKGLCFQVKLL